MDYTDYNGIFADRLEPGESILWSQEPKNKLLKFICTDTMTFVAGAAFILAGFSLRFMLLTGGTTDRVKKYAPLVFVVFGIWVVVSSFKFNKKYHAVTDRRICTLSKNVFNAISMADVKHVMINRINQLLVYTKLSDSFGNDMTADFNVYEKTWITESDSSETGLLFDEERGFYIIPLEEKSEVVEEVKDIIIRQARKYNGYI